MALVVISEFAPAKINLALHVTGKRDDGYHLLDSLVVFADVGDHLSFQAADALGLTIDGPFGADLTGRNLVLDAARLFGDARGAQITLTKNLPVASGIGGGSSDAAAALRGLSRLWSRPVPDAVALGADVPVCLSLRPARMRGIGEVVEPLPALPPLYVVLANPGVAVPTASVFRQLKQVDGAGLPAIPLTADVVTFADWLAACRNDLESPAYGICPAIAPLLADLAALDGCLLARMSGSGATCFALFADLAGAQAGARELAALRPGYWITAATILP